MRDEIVREDNLIGSRITGFLTFQGFLMSALGFMISGVWATDKLDHLSASMTLLREYILFALGWVGIIAALTAIIGIAAGRSSLNKTRQQWEEFLASVVNNYSNYISSVEGNRRYKCAPRAYGEKLPYRLGEINALALPVVFIAWWSIYLVYFALLVSWPPLPFINNVSTGNHLAQPFSLDASVDGLRFKQSLVNKTDGKNGGSSGKPSIKAPASNQRPFSLQK